MVLFADVCNDKFAAFELCVLVLTQLKIHISRYEINLKEEIKYLRIVLDDKLMWAKHVDTQMEKNWGPCDYD